MDTILAALMDLRQSSYLPLIQPVVFFVFFVLPVAMFGVAFCREDIRAALRHVGLSEKEVAFDLGICQALLSRKLSGDKALTFESLENMPREFWQWFAVLLAQRYGTPDVTEAAAALRRQARMLLPLEATQKGIA